MKRRRLNALIAEEQSPPPEGGSHWPGGLSLGFDFGFNNPKFSNYILHIKAEQERESAVDVPALNEGDTRKRKRKLESSEPAVSLHVNSLLLSAHSDFFKSLFTNDMLESRASEVSVHVAEDEIPLLEDIIRFVYNGKFQTPPDNMIHLLFVADKFLFAKVADDIIEHHKTSLTVDQCIQYLDLNEALQASTFAKLHHHVKRHLAKEFRIFDQVWNTEEFLHLPVRALIAVLESDSLILQSENTILSGLLAWVNADPITRAAEFKELVKYIRFGHMDPSFLVDVVQRVEPIASHPEFLSIYKKVQAYKSQKMEVRSGEPFMMPRIYTDKGSSRFTWDFRQITRMDIAQPAHSDKFYWRGYYLYLSVQKAENKLEVSVHVDQEKSGIPLDQHITLKHESTLDLKNYDTGLYDHIAKNFTSYYSRGSVTLFCIDWEQFINPQCPYVDHEDVLSVSLKVKLRSRGMCRLCGSLAYQLCGRCRGIYYCSKECQKNHWKDHKKDCRPAEAADGINHNHNHNHNVIVGAGGGVHVLVGGVGVGGGVAIAGAGGGA